MELLLTIKPEKLIQQYNYKGDKEELYKQIFEEIKVFINKTIEIKIINSKWINDEEKNEYRIIFDIKSSFSNPLNVLSDINKNYSFFRIQLNSKY